MTELGLPHIYSGKVRDIYDAGDGRLLMVTSDRMSAFWFEQFADEVGSHLISTDLADLPESAQQPEIAGRFMLCRRAEMLPVECIVRGYITGSAWKEYRNHGTMHGAALPEGLQESDRLPAAVFTPSTKAEVGDHDENISLERAVELIGEDLAVRARDLSLALYARGAELAAERGIIIADTKFEMGLVDGELVLADEVLTPDSSRFWPADDWVPGTTPPSFDKQPIRDYLETLDWNKQAPPPPLPDEVVEASSVRYREAYERITGRSLADWPGAS